jgi:hypothetical protein
MNQKQDRLIRDVEKKCTTIMIGSLARFEKAFEHLWEKENEIGDKYHDLWQNVRHDILNFANHQSRLAVENLYKHFIEEKQNTGKNYYEFRFDNKKGE